MNKPVRPQLQGGKVLSDAQNPDGSFYFPYNFINWILEKLLGTGDGTHGIKQQEQIPEPIIESIPEPELTELQKLIKSVVRFLMWMKIIFTIE